MVDLLKNLNRCVDPDSVFRTLLEFYQAHGFNSVIRASPSAIEPNLMEYAEVGWPAEYLAKYDEHRLERSDPYLEHAIKTGECFVWSEIGEKVDLTPAQHAMVNEFEKSVPGGGMVFPTLGRHDRFGMTVISRPDNPQSLAHADRLLLHAAAQQAHIRMDQIASAKKPAVGLSMRESEILFWIARGKSNADIGTILAISPATVGTYIKRLFDKLNVSDRTTAAVLGLQMGLIGI